jgi:hypothetical protein
MNKVTFHRNGHVSVDGVLVGTWLAPDPSGAQWVRTPVWVFRANDGVVENSRYRKRLADFARDAAARQKAKP